MLVKPIQRLEYEQLDLHDLSKIQTTVWYEDGTVEQFDDEDNRIRLSRQAQEQYKG